MQADNYIQTPEDYIGYNRYAYCRYNPFKYTDPSGEMLRYWFPIFNPGAEIANPIVYCSRSDELRYEMAAERAEEGDASFSLLWSLTGGLRKFLGGPGGESSSLGYKGSDILPTAVTVETIKTGQTIMGKDGKQYTKGKDGLFYEAGNGTENTGDNQISTSSSTLLNGLSWVASATLGIFSVIPEEPIARAICKSSTYLSIGVAAIDIGLILYDAKENGFNHSTFWGIVTSAGLCGLSNVYPPVGVPVSAVYWIGDAFCQKYNNGASMVQMYTFYNYGEYPTPWLRK